MRRDRDQRRRDWEHRRHQYREHMEHWKREHPWQHRYFKRYGSRLGPRILIRIFLTFLLTAFVLLGGVFMLSRTLSPDHRLSPAIEKNVVFYLESLQQKLNQSLNEDGIKNFENELKLSARVEGFDRLADQQGLPKFSDLHEQDEKFSDKIAVGHSGGYFFAELKGASPRTVWFVSPREFPRNFTFPFLGIAGFILFILVLSFLTIRWMMLPIKSVLVGVNKVTAGDLRYRIHMRQRGDFQIIGEAFNRMADGLEKMLVAKEQLLRDVSHELRSPLTRVSVAVDLMPDEKLKASIKDDLRKMEDLISQILESYRIKEGVRLQKAPADLCELIENVVGDYEASAPGVKFSSCKDAVVEIDAMQIERVLINLIENAIKYSKPDSSPIVVTLDKSKTDWLIKVRDNGTGISEKDLPHIFEPFYRADAVRTPGKSGFGLGLAIAKSIVEAHQGSLTVSSQLGEGSEFTIRLPADKYD
ncbi:MAG: HAMP domain-containing histidine kinase [Bdellovibrionales bacterium]|nr:HAMP domain-containing histidine kinase [Bdellovibrionales bacterium]